MKVFISAELSKNYQLPGTFLLLGIGIMSSDMDSIWFFSDFVWGGGSPSILSQVDQQVWNHWPAFKTGSSRSGQTSLSWVKTKAF